MRIAIFVWYKECKLIAATSTGDVVFIFYSLLLTRINRTGFSQLQINRVWGEKCKSVVKAWCCGDHSGYQSWSQTVVDWSNECRAEWYHGSQTIEYYALVCLCSDAQLGSI